jgi:hypothetical protein
MLINRFSLPEYSLASRASLSNLTRLTTTSLTTVSLSVSILMEKQLIDKTNKRNGMTTPFLATFQAKTAGKPQSLHIHAV